MGQHSLPTTEHKKFLSGWLHTKFVRIVSGGGSSSSFRTRYGAEFTLEISSTDLDCSESYDGGYDRCEVEIDFNISSNYNGFDEPTVNVTCEAELKTFDKSGFPMPKSDSESTSVYVREGYGSVEIDVSVTNYMDPVLRVKLDDANCEIESVY